ncbi:MAG: hypothetical protein V1800_12750 [Candidatus Latescibacterota bacterium]
MSKIRLGKSTGWMGVAGTAIPLAVQVADAILSQRRKKRQAAERQLFEEVRKTFRGLKEKDDELAKLRGQLALREEEVFRVRKELAEVYVQLRKAERSWWRKWLGK